MVPLLLITWHDAMQVLLLGRQADRPERAGGTVERYQSGRDGQARGVLVAKGMSVSVKVLTSLVRYRPHATTA